MLSDKPINKILNIPDEPKQEVMAPQKLSLAEVESEEERERIKKEEEQFNRDFEVARSNVLFVLDSAKDALEKISRIADDKESSREFDSLNNLLRTVSDSASVLVNLQERKKKYREQNRSGGKSSDSTTNIQNAVFVGSQSELKDFIRKMKSES